MPSSIAVKPIRREFPSPVWMPPKEFGSDGWMLVTADRESSVIVSVGRFEDGHEWVHASIANLHTMPTYDDLQRLHRAINSRWAFEVFAPPSVHVNLHQFARHLWARLDGTCIHPAFGQFGTI